MLSRCRRVALYSMIFCISLQAASSSQSNVENKKIARELHARFLFVLGRIYQPERIYALHGLIGLTKFLDDSRKTFAWLEKFPVEMNVKYNGSHVLTLRDMSQEGKEFKLGNQVCKRYLNPFALQYFDTKQKKWFFLNHQEEGGEVGWSALRNAEERSIYQLTVGCKRTSENSLGDMRFNLKASSLYYYECKTVPLISVEKKCKNAKK